jgi:hypothetical protein
LPSHAVYLVGVTADEEPLVNAAVDNCRRDLLVRADLRRLLNVAVPTDEQSVGAETLVST